MEDKLEEEVHPRSFADFMSGKSKVLNVKDVHHDGNPFEAFYSKSHKIKDSSSKQSLGAFRIPYQCPDMEEGRYVWTGSNNLSDPSTLSSLKSQRTNSKLYTGSQFKALILSCRCNYLIYACETRNFVCFKPT